jgi:hypothetical protein
MPGGRARSTGREAVSAGEDFIVSPAQTAPRRRAWTAFLATDEDFSKPDSEFDRFEHDFGESEGECCELHDRQTRPSYQPRATPWVYIRRRIAG